MKDLPLPIIPVMVLFCAPVLRAQTAITAWGSSANSRTSVPANLLTAVAISAGSVQSLALKEDGSLTTWGGGSGNWDSPYTVPTGPLDIVDMDACSNYALVVKRDGTVERWGKDSTNYTEPPAGLSGVLLVSAAHGHCLALKADGTVIAWGEDYNRKTRVPAGLSGVVAVAAGGEHSLALRADGTVVGWGEDTSGQSTPPPGLGGVVAIAAGFVHSLALKTDGTVVAWGRYENSTYGRLMPRDLTRVVAIAAGSSHSLALREDGTVAGWGFGNQYGEATVPANLSGVAAIDAGSEFSLALTGSGPPKITCRRPWIAEAAGARPGTVVFRKYITATGRPASFSAAGLPPGLTLNPQTGVIHGAPTAVGKFPITLSATNATGTGTSTVELTVTGAPTFLSPPPARAGYGASIQLTGIGFYTARGLPPGMQLNPSTGLISGVGPPGHYAVELTLSNPYGSQTLSWPLEISPVAAWSHSLEELNVPGNLGNVVALAAGMQHSLALKADGTVVAWGLNQRGETAVPPGLTGVIDIAAAEQYSVALKADGTIAAWGGVTGGASHRAVKAIAAGTGGPITLQEDGLVRDWNGVLAGPAGLSGVTSITAGGGHYMALKADGTVAAWGSNSFGQTTIPAIPGGIAGLAAGAYHSLALQIDGSVTAWGSNTYGARQVPPGLSGVVEIAAGNGHSMALMADGTVASWGGNSHQQPAGLAGISKIAAGTYHKLALTGSGGAPRITSSRRWVTEAAGSRPGTVYFYQRIMATDQPSSYGAAGLPSGLQLNSSTGVITGAALTPGTHMVTVSATNAAGTGTVDVELSVTGSPMVVNPLPAWTEAGMEMRIYSVGRTSVSGLPRGLQLDEVTGQITGTGEPGTHVMNVTVTNAHGASTVPWALEVSPLNIWGTTSPLPSNPAQSPVPYIPPGLGNVAGIAAGGAFTLVLRADGTVINPGGATVPAGLTDVISVAQGKNHSLALKSDGSVVSWGGNTTVPAGLAGVVRIAAGDYHSLALKDDGTVVGWGSTVAVPAGLSGVKELAAGAQHSLALKTDGTVIAWGPGNPWGGTPPESIVPAGLGGVMAIAAGGNHSLALKSDGTVVGWGNGSYGQNTIPSNQGRVAAIAEGDFHSLALKEDGTVVGWGHNSYLQATVPSKLNKVKAIDGGGTHSVALVHVPPALPDAVVGRAFFFTWPPGVALARFSATSLPPGLVMDAASGEISGIPAEAGNWNATITMSNRAHTWSDSATFAVLSRQAAYNSWNAAIWPAGGSASTPGADPDQDGAANLLEYAAGTDPVNAGIATRPAAHRDETGRLILTLDVPAERVGLVIWQAQFAGDLSFSAMTPADPQTVAGAPPGKTRLQFVDTSGEGPRRYGRLSVQVPP